MCAFNLKKNRHNPTDSLLDTAHIFSPSEEVVNMKRV